MKKLIAVIIAAMLLAVLPMSAAAAEADAGTFTLHAYVPDGWNDPCFYGWGGSLSMTWPGEAMTAEGDGWYTFEVAADAEGLIVNANGGTVQTPDIKSFEAKEMWVVVAADTTVTVAYEKPDLGEIAEEKAAEEAAAAAEAAARAEEAARLQAAIDRADTLCWIAAGVIVAAAVTAGALLGARRARKRAAQ